MIKDHIAPFAITFSFHHGDSTSGAIRISLVVTKAELKRMLRDRNENDSQQTSLELLLSNMVLRDKRVFEVEKNARGINSWRPALERIPEDCSMNPVDSLNHKNKNQVGESIGVLDFEVLKVVGQGAFGKVYRVRRDATNQQSLVIVYFGGNDSMHRHLSGLSPHVPLQEYIENMKKIVIHLKNKNGKILTAVSKFVKGSRHPLEVETLAF
ncbi:hypothetical protein JHK85_040855 [Glycine max]|nr:hypothetical protein JHK85_040855 [Glycine max]